MKKKIINTQNNKSNRKTTSVEPNAWIQMSTTWATWLSETHIKIKALLLRIHSKNMSILKLEPLRISLLTPTAPNSDGKQWPTLKSNVWRMALTCVSLHWLKLQMGHALGGTGSLCSRLPVLGQWLMLTKTSIWCWWPSVTGHRSREWDKNKWFPAGTAHGTGASAQCRVQQSSFDCPSMQF